MEGADSGALRTSAGRALIPPGPGNTLAFLDGIRCPWPLVSAEATRTFCQTTPNLKRLVVMGDGVFSELRHGALRELFIAGFGPIHRLGTFDWYEAEGVGPERPKLERLEFFLDATAAIPADFLCFDPDRLPSLRHLALHGPNLKGVLDWIASAESDSALIVEQLETLRLPALGQSELDAIVRAVPKLRHRRALVVADLCGAGCRGRVPPSPTTRQRQGRTRPAAQFWARRAGCPSVAGTPCRSKSMPARRRAALPLRQSRLFGTESREDFLAPKREWGGRRFDQRAAAKRTCGSTPESPNKMNSAVEAGSAVPIGAEGTLANRSDVGWADYVPTEPRRFCGNQSCWMLR